MPIQPGTPLEQWLSQVASILGIVSFVGGAVFGIPKLIGWLKQMQDKSRILVPSIDRPDLPLTKLDGKPEKTIHWRIINNTEYPQKIEYIGLVTEKGEEIEIKELTSLNPIGAGSVAIRARFPINIDPRDTYEADTFMTHIHLMLCQEHHIRETVKLRAMVKDGMGNKHISNKGIDFIIDRDGNIPPSYIS
jgi:hypothetical protein